MQLVIDLGNTRQKWAIFDQRELILQGNEKNIDATYITNLALQHSNITHCIVSAVIEIDAELKKTLNKLFKTIYLNHNTLIPIKNLYSTPETLGKDRLACAVAIASLTENQSALSIDLGTAIKFDFVSKEKEYLGGSISPGLTMRFQALHNFTAHLPFVGYQSPHPLIGKDTLHSMVSGVVNGIIAEVNGMIDMYLATNTDLQIYFTGGDFIHFENKFKSGTFADPNLVLKGLNEILIFNEK